MLFRFLTVFLAVYCYALSSLFAQSPKIAYTNIEYILTFMPEAKQMQQQLDVFEKKLSEQLSVKQSYAQGKLEEYYKLVEEKKLTHEQDEARKKELLKLEDEIKKFTSDSEAQLLTKKEELLKPIIDKLQTAINTVAKEDGYTIVLNSSNSTGVSNILYAPESDNITEKIIKKLGLNLAPPPSNTPKPNTPGGK
ncbi:MAG: OmpH family outer membrane protein [Bacteroidia bacterium]|nr:OmpH family outer membrane protein [Bacteroidia bacterium]